MRLLRSSVGVGFPRSSDTADYSRNEMGMVQPRLVENRLYAYKAYPQAVEDELDRKDTRLFPSRQCLFHSHGAVFPTNVCVLFPHRQPHLSGGHRSFPVVRKESL